LENNLEPLAKKIRQVMSNPAVRSTVEARVADFDRIREKGTDEEWFSELCFCLMTANWTARGGIAIQKVLGDGCLTLSQTKVEQVLADHGHRFARPRADYICKARKLPKLRAVIEAQGDDRRAREWLIENVLGLGYKEASHFLRNTGHYDVAILDRHILAIMHEYALIQEIPKTITPKRYKEMEKTLERLSTKLKIPLGILDFYIWYMRTEEVLK
jgi:N-glycosylase/DNA lyase